MRTVLAAMLAAVAACGGGGTTPGPDGSPDADPGAPDAAGPDPSAEIYDPDTVIELALELPGESVTALEADPRTYVHGTLHYGDEVVADIGVRIKGEYNFRPLGQKAPFKLKFDAYVAGQTFHGLKRMTLNNAIEDPSWVAERLTYAVFRDAGLAAPRANLAWVTVNGEAYGLYVNVETEDKRMVGRWFADDGGNIYEEQGAELAPGNEYAFELETNVAADDRSDLTALFAAIQDAHPATFLADLAGVLDTTAFLRFCAAEAAVWQWDGYCYTRFGPNNFRLYHEPTANAFYFLPWGMDMSWKSYEPGLDVFDARGFLLQRCLNSDGCNAAYRAELRATADRLEAVDVVGLAQAWGEQARPYVEQDPKKETDLGGYMAALGDVRAQAAARPGDLRAQAP